MKQRRRHRGKENEEKCKEKEKVSQTVKYTFKTTISLFLFSESQLSCRRLFASSSRRTRLVWRLRTLLAVGQARLVEADPLPLDSAWTLRVFPCLRVAPTPQLNPLRNINLPPTFHCVRFSSSARSSLVTPPPFSPRPDAPRCPRVAIQLFSRLFLSPLLG